MRAATSPTRAALALLVANFRYWLTVWPCVRVDLIRWRTRALAVPDPDLRGIALGKLADERFNSELSATLATLAPTRARSRTSNAIVSLQLAYDLLDGITERPLADQVEDGMALHRPFIEAFAPDREHRTAARAPLDGDYLHSLASTTGERGHTLPCRQAIAATAQSGASRCAEAQVRLHAAAQQPADASADPPSQTQEAPELLAGASASVLCLHALLAASANPATTVEDAKRLDDLYLSIGAITMLDSIVDAEQDLLTGQRSWVQQFQSPEEMGARLAAVAQTALARARVVPRTAHHVITLAGAIAFYASAPSAETELGRSVVGCLREQLGGLLGPPMLVMRLWRTAKRIRRLPAARVTLAALAIAVTAGVAVAQAEARSISPHARLATTLRASDSAHLHYVSASGSTLYETGHASGTLPGQMRVHMQISSTFSGSFVISTAGGTIEGKGAAKPHGSGVYESFAGTLQVTGGSGRYRHAHGSGKIYGVFDRDNYALTIETTGKLFY